MNLNIFKCNFILLYADSPIHFFYNMYNIILPVASYMKYLEIVHDLIICFNLHI